MVEPAPISATGKTPTFSRCPFCDAPPDSKVERVERTMFVGDYRCPSDHVWMLKTVVGQ